MTKSGLDVVNTSYTQLHCDYDALVIGGDRDDDVLVVLVRGVNDAAAAGVQAACVISPPRPKW